MSGEIYFLNSAPSSQFNIIGKNLNIRDVNMSFSEASFSGLMGSDITHTIIGEKRLEGPNIVKMNEASLKMQEVEVEILEGKDMQLSAQYISVKEQYLPLIVSSKNISVSFNYNVEHQVDYEKLRSGAMKFKGTKLECEDFTLVKPLSYSLDIERLRATFTPGPILKASEVQMEKVELYSIYYELILGAAKCGGSRTPFHDMFIVKATGDTPLRKAIFHFWRGFALGRQSLCHPIHEVLLHVIYMRAEWVKMKEVKVLSASY